MRLEDYTRFQNRIYCSKSCSARRNYDSLDKSRDAFQLEARKYRKEYCEHCGSSVSVQIHHIDSNWKNNSPSNLMSLCKTCHMKLHWQQWKSPSR